MNRETGLNLAMALLAIGALGVAATTFESATSTDADDVIDLDYDRLPIGQDDAATIQREMNAGESEGAAEGDDSDADESERSDADAAEDSEADAADGASDAADSRSGSDGSSGAADSSDDAGERGGASDLPGETPGQLSLLGRLLALLAALVPYLLLLAAVLVAAWLAVRHRDRLRALLDRRNPAADDGAAVDDWLDGRPSNAVDRTWVGMVRALDLDRPAAMTPGECASAAVRAGFDPEAVDALTRAFEEVRYGGRPVTERRERVARRTGRRLAIATGADDPGGGLG